MNGEGPIQILGQRALRGPNLHAPQPLWRLALRIGTALDAAGPVLKAAGLHVEEADPGRLIASTALSLQQAAGINTDWIHAEKEPNGDWVVVYSYEYEKAGQEAGRKAVELIASVLDDRPPDVAKAVEAVRLRRAEEAASASVEALLAAAERRGIPVMRHNAVHHQLGWGHKQEQLWGSVPGRLSGLGYESANDHERVQEILADSGIPIAPGESCDELDECRQIAARIGYPVTVKPLRGRGGITVRVDDEEALDAAARRAKQHHDWVYIQQHTEGVAYRVLVVAHRVVAATRRSDKQDVTATMHPSIDLACRRAARLVGLDVIGVDLVAPDLQTPLRENGGRLVSLHPYPSLEPFLARQAADRIVERLFPANDGRIPLVAVTGTNGKTTTVRLIAHILKYAGARVGMAVTGALEVENQVILRGDYSGPTAARTVLREPGVTHAVCEVARGGILRSGLGFDACDVGVMLNVAADHLGEGGIETLEDLARLKMVVLRAVRPGGTLVLNADDPLVWGLRHAIPRNVIPFTLDPTHPDLEPHLAADVHNLAITMRDGAIMVRRGSVEFRGPEVVNIPLTLDGAALFNVQNAMAATAVAYALGINEEDIRAGLCTFNPSMNQLPGRMNLMQIGEVKVLVDYGHNVAAVNALATVLPRLTNGRKINVGNGTGNRRDEDLKAFGAALATHYDRIYITDPDPRGRAPGETARVVEQGILEAGFPSDAVTIEPIEAEAIRRALAESRGGDLVVLQVDDVEAAIRLCRDLEARLRTGDSPAALHRDLLETDH